jgi:hypothetical protein
MHIAGHKAKRRELQDFRLAYHATAAAIMKKGKGNSYRTYNE